MRETFTIGDYPMFTTAAIYLALIVIVPFAIAIKNTYFS